MIAKVLLCVFLAGAALAQNYGDDQEADEQQLSYASQSYNPTQYDRAEPYDFGFQSTDEFGTIMNRQESSDNNGAVRGSYGYTDPFGVFRHVDYVADEYGFRAEVKSNEPGMGTQSPANVQIYAEPPPAGVIVERAYHHHPHGHAQAASGQQASRRNPSAASSSAAVRQVRPSAGRAASSSGATVTRTVYPYNQQQNTYSSNSAASSNNQYPATVSSQYAANSAASSGNQYSTEYSASSAGASASAGYQASASSYPASVYPARNPYGAQGYATLSSSQYGSSSSGSQQAPIVAKPYDGPTYKIGNPHVTEFKRSDKQHSYLLPTVVATGNAPTTLVKHIHTYPAAQA